MAARILAVAALVTIGVTGVLLRFIPVAGPDGDPIWKVFPDDAPYHMLRLERILDDRFSFADDLGRPDPWIAYPEGDVCIWPWGYDMLLAGVASVVRQGDASCDRECVQRVAGVIPPLFSLLCSVLVAVAAGIALKGSRLAGILSGTLFLMAPVSVSYSLFGRSDHHVMEPLMLSAACAFLIAKRRLKNCGRRFAVNAGLSGLILGSCAAFFPAAPALALPVGALSGLYAATATQHKQPVMSTLTFCIGLCVGTMMSMLLSPLPLTWSFHSASLWHLASAVILSIGLSAFAVTFNMGIQRGRTLKAVAAGAAGLAIPALVLFGAAPGFRSALVGGTGYTMSNDIARMSLEASSFFDSPSRFASQTGWLIVPAIVGLLITIWKRESRDLLYLGAVFAATVALAAFQRRFLFAAMPFVAIEAAVALSSASRAIGRLLPKRLSGIGAMTYPVLAAALLIPSITTDISIEGMTPRDRAMYSAAQATGRIADSEPRKDAEAVLAPWGYGHLIKMVAGIPTTCDNFFGVPAADAAIDRCLKMLYEKDEVPLADALKKNRVRFVLLIPPHPDQIRVETALAGYDPAEWVDRDGRLTSSFAGSFYGKTGLWAATAATGSTGPWGMRLRGRFRQVDPVSGSIVSEVFLLETPVSDTDGSFEDDSTAEAVREKTK